LKGEDVASIRTNRIFALQKGEMGVMEGGKEKRQKGKKRERLSLSWKRREPTGKEEEP